VGAERALPQRCPARTFEQGRGRGAPRTEGHTRLLRGNYRGVVWLLERALFSGADGYTARTSDALKEVLEIPVRYGQSELGALNADNAGVD
jgi:hypothetical protein